MTLQVLRANGPDQSRWQALLERFPPRLRDFHYYPEYGLIYHDTFGHEPMLAVFESKDCIVLHAFVRRSLRDLPFVAGVGSGHDYHDIATPYGFGGPLASGPKRDETCACLRAFDEAFKAWCIEERLASEFVCLHPVLQNHRLIDESGIVAPVATKDVVIVDLQQPEESLWRAVSRGTRSSIQHARRAGILVEEVEPNDSALKVFHALYFATMERKGAAARWFVPTCYFENCVRRLGRGRSALLFARRGKELAAAYLLLHDEHTAYYHFGASDARSLHLRPNNLLMYESILWARRRGVIRYHLGGGVTADENDSLLRFKSSFGGSRSVLYTYGRILNQDVYRELCALKRRHEASASHAVSDPGYFPLYRRS